MIVVGIWLLKKDYRTWLWFIVGNGISGGISLYYFQNGALLSFAERAGFMGEGGMQGFLVDKQIYPMYLKSVIYSVLFPLVALFGLPWITVISVIIFAAFFVLINGGSRSSFGANLLSSFFFIGYAYFKRITKTFIDNFVLLCVAGIIVVSIIFSIYKNLAIQGKLGQEEYDKFYSEMVDSEAGVLGSRDDIMRAWPFLSRHPIVGAGSSSLDRWGYIEDDIKLPGHSALVGAWVQNGIFGLVFWGYVLWMIMVFVQKRVMSLQLYAPFTVMKTVSMVWAILFSPFGGYRGDVSLLIALCAVAQDEQWLRKVSMMLTKRRRSGHNGQLMRQR
jgi:O-antigen ligase